MTQYLILDLPNLVYRFHYAMISKFNDPGIFGMLRSLQDLVLHLGSNRFVFCFDCEGGYLRAKQYPNYKNKDSSLEKSYVQRQIESLRKEVLPALGYANIFQYEGAEADDVIGFLCKYRKPGDRYTLVSSDKDLYQLLDSDLVTIWNQVNKETITEEKLLNRYKLTPKQWIELKAIMGCDSDNIKGIPFVGQGRAMTYILDKMSSLSPTYKRIEKNQDLIEANKRLVTLPYPELPDLEFDILEDDFNTNEWNRICNRYEFHSLIGRYP